MSLRDKYTNEEWNELEKFIRLNKKNEPRDVIQNIVDKIYERRAHGKESQVAIMSYSDYYAIESLYGYRKSIEVMGSTLKIHASRNLQDGEIEIY